MMQVPIIPVVCFVVSGVLLLAAIVVGKRTSKTFLELNLGLWTGALSIVLLVIGLFIYGEQTYGPEEYHMSLLIEAISMFTGTLLGIVITVLIIDSLNKKRSEQEYLNQLIQDMRGQSNEFAKRAVDILRTHPAKPLTSGMLREIDFRNAQLQGANLEGINLMWWDLEGANLRGAILPDGNVWSKDVDMRTFTDPSHPKFFWMFDSSQKSREEVSPIPTEEEHGKVFLDLELRLWIGILRSTRFRRLLHFTTLDVVERLKKLFILYNLDLWGGAVGVIFLIISLFSYGKQTYGPEEYYMSLVIEAISMFTGILLSTIVSVLIIERRSKRRSDQKFLDQLVQDARGRSNEFAKRAIDILQEHPDRPLVGGWMTGILRGKDFRNAQLQGANLEGVNLEYSWLEGANLEYANLNRARLGYANLQGAQLLGATLPNGERWNKDTDMRMFTDPNHPDFQDFSSRWGTIYSVT